MFKFLIILPSLLLKKTVYFFRFRSAILPKRKTLSTRNMSPAGDDIVSDHDRKFIELRKECVTKSWLNKSLAGRIVVNLMRMNTKRVEVDFVCKSFSCSWIRLPINKCSWISNWMEINARIFILHIIFRRRVPTEIQNWLEFSVGKYCAGKMNAMRMSVSNSVDSASVRLAQHEVKSHDAEWKFRVLCPACVRKLNNSAWFGHFWHFTRKASWT